jgi:hypothetical protein
VEAVVAELDEPNDAPRSKRTTSRGSRAENLAVAAALMVGGAMCLGAPSYFDATAGWSILWNVLGVGLALFGAVGAIASTTDGKLRDGGVAAFLGALALGAYAATVTLDLGSPWTGVLKAAAFVVAWWAVFGVCRGIARRVDGRRTAPRPSDTSRTNLWVPLMIAVLGVSAASLNVVQALLS